MQWWIFLFLAVVTGVIAVAAKKAADKLEVPMGPKSRVVALHCACVAATGCAAILFLTAVQQYQLVH
jgi:uncharacterized protein involved in high-affinity Fe2+ transport